jgi:hypothetical protein
MSQPGDASKMLLGLAADDEFAARSLLPVEGVTDGVLGFHCQQAVEKALKSVLARRDVEFPYTHDLDGLLRLCQKSEIEVPQDLAGVGRLSVFGVRLRYGARATTSLDRAQALSWAASAVQWAQQQVGVQESAQPAAEAEGREAGPDAPHPGARE